MTAAADVGVLGDATRGVAAQDAECDRGVRVRRSRRSRPGGRERFVGARAFRPGRVRGRRCRRNAERRARESRTARSAAALRASRRKRRAVAVGGCPERGPAAVLACSAASAGSKAGGPGQHERESRCDQRDDDDDLRPLGGGEHGRSPQNDEKSAADAREVDPRMPLSPAHVRPLRCGRPAVGNARRTLDCVARNPAMRHVGDKAGPSGPDVRPGRRPRPPRGAVSPVARRRRR